MNQGGPTQDCVLYWEMIGAILTAAHLYRIAHDEFENRRDVQNQGGDATLALIQDDAPPPMQAFMDDYIASRNLPANAEQVTPAELLSMLLRSRTLAKCR